MPVPSTILLAEDDVVVRQLMRAALERAGHTVLEARDGEHAIEIATRLGHAVDLLLADIVMPRMGGYVLAARLRVIHPAAKILFTTGHVDISAAVRAGRSDRATQFILKPFTPGDLAARVREVLDGS